MPFARLSNSRRLAGPVNFALSPLRDTNGILVFALLRDAADPQVCPQRFKKFDDEPSCRVSAPTGVIVRSFYLILISTSFLWLGTTAAKKMVDLWKVS